VLDYESELSENSLKKKVVFKLIRIFRKIKLGLLLFNFPNFDPLQSRKVYKQIEFLYRKDRYDCIIAIFKPYWNIAALKKFKKTHPETRCIGYYLDLVNSMQKPKLLPQKVYEWLCYKESISTFKCLDLILMAKAGKELYEYPKYDEVRGKIRYVDFPTFVTHININSIKRSRVTDDSKTVITYAGTLDKKYRNPEILLKILDKVSSVIGYIELNIYGRNNCDEIFTKYSCNPFFRIKNYGLCSHDVVINAMIESDILVNISSTIQNAVPSKIFELFSIGKPIINVIFDQRDITISYFNKYPSVLNIKAWRPYNEQIEEVIKFISLEKGKQYNTEEIIQNYIENTPGYTVDIIEELILCKGN